MSDFYPFDRPEADLLNRARMEHLLSLGLPLRGARVLEPGAGVGHLTDWLEEAGAIVTATEGRPTNCAENLHRHPGRAGRVFHRDAILDAAEFAPQDIVVCYGLLYHVIAITAVLHSLAACGAPLVVVESIVLDSDQDEVRYVVSPERTDSGLFDEEARPSPLYLARALALAGWGHVYAPLTVPAHTDFQWEHRNNGDWERGGHNLRAVLVGSQQPLDWPMLWEYVYA